MKIIRLVYSFVVFIFMTLTSCTQLKNERCYQFNKKYPQVLEKSEGKHDTSTLIQVLGDIIKSDSCVDAYLTRGDLYYRINDLNKAKSDYKNALLLDTGNVYALYKLGLVFQDENIYDSSIYFFERGVNKKTHKGFLIDHGQGRGVLSADDAKYDVRSVELLYEQGLSHYYAKNLKSALNNFNFCIQNNFRIGECFLYRGAIFLEGGKKDQACKDFNEAKRFGDSDADSYINKYCSGNVSK
jgi:tetratricopeptide (TPR) repeat protein